MFSSLNSVSRASLVWIRLEQHILPSLEILFGHGERRMALVTTIYLLLLPKWRETSLNEHEKKMKKRKGNSEFFLLISKVKRKSTRAHRRKAINDKNKTDGCSGTVSNHSDKYKEAVSSKNEDKATRIAKHMCQTRERERWKTSHYPHKKRFTAR